MTTTPALPSPKRNLRAQAEDHIRRTILPTLFAQQRFVRERIALTTGGEFDFDAVSLDEKTVCCISTSVGVTSGGNSASSKLHKMKADILNLHLLPPGKRKVMVFSDAAMARLLQREADALRIPADIEILTVALPAELAAALAATTAKQTPQPPLDAQGA